MTVSYAKRGRWNELDNESAIIEQLTRIADALENKQTASEPKTEDKTHYTKTCNGCNGQIVMRKVNEKWGAYENYNTDDYHSCKNKQEEQTALV